MCRFVAYLGHPITLDEVIFQPRNSLVRQSMHAKEMKGDGEPFNGDGFGLGWYNPEIDNQPALFTSIQPAWNDRNLRYITPKIFSHCLMAHVRAATTGGVTQFNCHPFHYQQFLFMHNGNIGGFSKIKRHLRHELSDPIYDWVKGQTDSEHFSALFLQHFAKYQSSYDIYDITKAFLEALKQLLHLQNRYDVKEPNYLNFVITDGESLVVSRYTNSAAEDASTLYYSYGDHYTCEEGSCHLPNHDEKPGAVLVVSEKLDSHRSEWHEVPANHLLLIHKDLSIELNPMVLKTD